MRCGARGLRPIKLANFNRQNATWIVRGVWVTEMPMFLMLSIFRGWSRPPTRMRRYWARLNVETARDGILNKHLGDCNRARKAEA